MTLISSAVLKMSHNKSRFCQDFLYSGYIGLDLIGGNCKRSPTAMTVIPVNGLLLRPPKSSANQR